MERDKLNVVDSLMTRSLRIKRKGIDGSKLWRESSLTDIILNEPEVFF